MSKYLGEDVTNNQAEYHGLIAGLKAAQLEGATHLDIRGDSELVIKQVGVLAFTAFLVAITRQS